MENASKALIIAGAILISIIIISLGVMIVGNVIETIQQSSSVSEQERDAYNQPFLAYEGTRSGTQVRALCEKVRSHNQDYPDDVSRHIKLVYQDSGSLTLPTTVSTEAVTTQAISDVKAKIKTGNTYTVSLSYDSNSGYVVGIGIVKK